MKIELFLDNRLFEFKLPREVSGSFSFDANDGEVAKLINVEAREDQWFLYSTEDVKISDGGKYLLETALKVDNYYTLEKDGKTYLIYITNLYDKSFISYSFDKNIDLILGGGEDANVMYDILNEHKNILRVNYQNTKLVLSILSDKAVFVNNYAITTQTYELHIGDMIKFYGINILILNKIVLINNPQGLVRVNSLTSKLNVLSFSDSTPLSKDEVKNVDLYNETEYFSKSPRIKRFIETREIKLDPPPAQNNEDNNMPLLMVIGPMLTMSITSMTTLISLINRIATNQTTFGESWPQFLTGIAMLAGSLLWPLITKFYTARHKEQKAKELEEKYNKYLASNEEELQKEMRLQKEILVENLVPLIECLNNIQKRGVLFWNKRNDEKDFLVVRVGTGNVKLDVKINFPEEGFTVDEDELKKKTEALIEKYKYITDVPVGYSLLDNRILAIMGDDIKQTYFVNNIILQLITFWSYEDIKLVVFTDNDNESKWNYIKYLNHCFSNNREIRFFASSDEENKELANYLDYVIKTRENIDKPLDEKPYYIILTDCYDNIKKYDFIKSITESENNLGFSLVIVENKLSKLPSKCNSFISLVGKQSTIFKNSFDEQEIMPFNDEINYDVDMMAVARVLGNIPIEFEEGVSQIPDSINFLEMEKVGKVEQLNVLNRWNLNDATESLKAEVGVNEQGEIVMLDLHEKFHGPHGLVAGTTGSGKSEFIITYILSMCMNYSPDYVSFILIDYKGGGLAGAFENKLTGVVLPHLAGTITNLDKAEMDRTLVSIDSEVKRRQSMFNDARDKLGESTIDIYKYERFYREGKIEEPIPHLFIVCDEFAELKSQQPDFMDNLISVARIGRSLGVHLILATQKPSGVVNDQIWSNTKFRVCLKVANEADSKEMLKRPEAAFIKQTGRFYLQVGTDELFELGQSAWCGAKYFPSNQIMEEIDKNINFISNNGRIFKSIKASSNKKIVAQGEQLSAVLNEIINVAKKVNSKARRLWLDNIPDVILVSDIVKKYNITQEAFNIKAILGEYDAPEKQEQGLLEYDLLEDGNTIIYGLDSSEREMLLNIIIYSTITLHSPDEINYYIIDYGSESSRMFSKFPHIGGMVTTGEDEKFKNLFKLIQEEIKFRKKELSSYGGEFKNYNKNATNKLPLKVFVFNNYDSIYENNQDLYDILPDLVRDSERYGIIFILTANNISSVMGRISQNFDNVYTFKLKEAADYYSAFGTRKKIEPRNIFGRGLADIDDVHEFQTCKIILDDNELNTYLINLGEEYAKKYLKHANIIPELPEKVTFEYIQNAISSLSAVPIGISKTELSVITYDFLANPGSIISSNKIINTNTFVLSLMSLLSHYQNLNLMFVDGTSKFLSAKNVVTNYYNDNFDTLFDKIIDYFSKLDKTNSVTNLLVIYGIDKLITSFSKKDTIQKLMDQAREKENVRVVVIDDAPKIKQYAFEQWFSKNFSTSDGIWIGKGIADQNIFKVSGIKKEDLISISNTFGYFVSDGSIENVKLIDFTKKAIGDEDEK